MRIQLPYTSLLMLGLAAGISSCSEDVAAGAERARTIRPIVSTSSISRAVMDKTALEAAGTFKMQILPTIGEKAVNYDTENHEWVIAGKPSWNESTPMTFYGYYPDGDVTVSETTAANMVFTFNESDGETDLLLARTAKSFDKDDLEVPLAFGHGLSKIMFDFSGLAPYINYDSGAGTADHWLTAISLKGFRTGGTCTLTSTGAEWSNLEGNAFYTIKSFTYPGTVSPMPRDYFLVVPQNLSTLDANHPALELEFHDGGTMQKDLTEVDVPLKPGKEYLFKLSKSAAPVDELAIAWEVKEWDDVDKTINFIPFDPSYVSSPMTYDGVHSIIQGAPDNKIVVHNGLPIQGAFTLTDDLAGCSILLALGGNVDAFEIENPVQTIVGGTPITVNVRPVIADPKRTYSAVLHVYLIKPDGTTEQIDAAALGTYNGYKLVLPAN